MEVNYINNIKDSKLDILNTSSPKNFEKKKNNKIIFNDDKIDKIIQETILQSNNDIINNINIQENIKNKNEINNYENYLELKKIFNNFSENTINEINKIKNILKKMDKPMEKNFLLSEKKKNKNIENKEKGITKKTDIPKSIILFYNLKENSIKSRIEIGKLFQKYLDDNSLKGNLNNNNKIDKRIYRLDDKLSKLFNISDKEKEKINSCSSHQIKYPNGFNLYNYHTWIKQLYN